MCQTLSYVTRDDMFDDDSLTEAVAADGLNMNKFHQRVVLSDREDFVDSDDEWDMLYDESLTEAVAADGPNMNEFYQRVVSSDEEDFVDSDDGSVTDLDRDMSD